MPDRNARKVEEAYKAAESRYGDIGVDVGKALEIMRETPISLHCWQGDDVRGFESPERGLSGGIQATGSYPGAARNPRELRADLDQALSLIPGRHRLNLHSIYAETGNSRVGRDELEPEHFTNWMDWAGERGMGLDFNPSFFSHPMAESGFTLSSPDEETRQFWIRHAQACRRIGAEFGRRLGSPCVTNIWIPDGYKDIPCDRLAPRRRLMDSLDQILAEDVGPGNLDAVESKLFGIGSESYVVGSHEFYLAYAVKNGVMPCFDAGHFHPTETIADKISAIMLFSDRLLLHISRGVRWDSDHVTILNDDMAMIFQEIVRGGFLKRVHAGLDFFDASINRVAAWVIGASSALKALLAALLEPAEKLRQLETGGNYTMRLAALEEYKTMPLGAAWDYYCMTSGVPVGMAKFTEIAKYESEVLSGRK